MKNLLFSCVLALALVALVGMGFAPTTGRAQSSEEKTSDTEIVNEDGGKNSGDKDKPDKDRAPGGGSYVHLQPMFLPVVSDSGAEQIVTLLIDIQVKDSDAALKIHQKMPRVQDSILQALYGGLGDGSLRKGHVVDIPKIKTKIVAVLDRIIEGHVIQDVLIQGVAQRTL